MIFHWIALFAFATAFSLHWLFVRRKQYLSRKKSYPIMFIGFLALTVFLIDRGKAIHSCPIGNPFEILTFIIWSSVFFYLLVSLLFSVNYLGFFSAGLASLLIVVLLLFPHLNYPYDVGDIHSSMIVGVHASLAVFSYGFFCLLSLFAAMYLVQYFGLTNRRAGSFFSILPPLTKLETLQTWALSTGVFILSVALFIGSFSFLRELGEIPVYKLAAAVVLWVYYVILLVLRFCKILFSSRFAWLALFGLLIALAALFPVDKARHELREKAPIEAVQ